MKIVVRAKSSSGEPYEVEFSADNRSLRVFCHCQAGILQQMCKHKHALISGDTTMLFDQSDSTLLAQIRSWPEFQKLRSRIEEYERTLNEIDAAKAELVAKEKAAKKSFAHGLARGFER